MKIFRKLLLCCVLLLVGALIFIFWANFTIKNNSEDYVFSSIDKVPAKKVALVLGTSKTLASGNPNLYFAYRIEAAAQLFKTGKIQDIIVSGDNSNKNYNEPEDMKNALVAAGVPDDKIFMDFAGLRTLDSVLRAKDIFGQNSYIVISQKFHNERAVYLARKNGIDA